MSDGYDHRFHAGNPGDVWKHVAWLAALAAHKHERVLVVDVHAGRGAYQLPRDGGEWTTGVARLWAAFPPGSSTGSGAVDRYLAKIGRGPRYPGSPALALTAMGRSDRLVAIEADPDTAGALRAELKPDGRVRVVHGDGWTVDPRSLGEPADARQITLIDPPFSERTDWTAVVGATARAHAAGSAVLLWYPVKRWSRPTAMLDGLREAGVPFVAVDLVHTPIELQPSGLAGSGVALVGMPRSVSVEVHAAAAVLGPVLATTAGRWFVRTTASG